MPRTKLIAANWKMNKTIAEAQAFAAELKGAVGGVRGRDLLVFPPFFSLPSVASALDGTGVAVGAQDLFWEERGAYTGEISAGMIRDAGGSYVLIGHSERRHVIGETNEIVARKLRAALQGGLRPVFCLGEKIEHREAGEHETLVQEQLASALTGISVEEMALVVIAYEPVWAIGTGKTATPEDAEGMHVFIRKYIGSVFSNGAAENVRIQYGGSVTPDNAADLLGRADIDGALIGGASLEVGSFIAIAGS